MTSRFISRLCCINPSPCAPKRTSHQQRTTGILGRCHPRRHCRRHCLPPFRRTPRRFPYQYPFQNCTAGNTQQTGRGNRTGQTGEILHPLLIPQQLHVRQCIRSLHRRHLSGPGLRPLQAVHGREDFQKPYRPRQDVSQRGQLQVKTHRMEPEEQNGGVIRAYRTVSRRRVQSDVPYRSPHRRDIGRHRHRLFQEGVATKCGTDGIEKIKDAAFKEEVQAAKERNHATETATEENPMAETVEESPQEN